MHLDIEHDIVFTYDDYISESWVELRMEPQSNARQTVNLFFLAVGPRTKVSRYHDWCGNAVRHFSIAEYHDAIQVKARSLVETKPPDVLIDAITEPVPDRAALGPIVDYLAFGGPITDSTALEKLAREIDHSQSDILGHEVWRIGEAVHSAIQYMPNVTSYHSTIDDALAQRAGVCQDIAQIMIGLLRLRGIPARYVNGYLHVAREERVTAESHAWVEFYSIQYGWVGFDPTGNVQPGEHHVVVGTGRHYDDVPPNRGVYRGSAKEQLEAVVRTREVQAPEAFSHREEIREIALPVYSELPDRRASRLPDDQGDLSSQQQQQQQ